MGTQSRFVKEVGKRDAWCFRERLVTPHSFYEVGTSQSQLERNPSLRTTCDWCLADSPASHVETVEGQAKVQEFLDEKKRVQVLYGERGGG